MRSKIILQPIIPGVIPWDYQHILASFIYNTLRDANPVLASELHQGKHRVDNKPVKLFCFSWLNFVRGASSTSEGLRPGLSPVEFILSSPDEVIVLNFVRNAWGRDVHINNSWYKVVAIELLPEPEFTKKKQVFTTLGPIVAPVAELDKNGNLHRVFLAPNDARYSSVLEQNLQRKYRLWTGKENLPVSIKICPGPIKSKLVNYKGTRIRGYHINIELTANPEIINLAWMAGIGSYNSLGFGMVEAI